VWLVGPVQSLKNYWDAASLFELHYLMSK
jgi:hypothetical protein